MKHYQFAVLVTVLVVGFACLFFTPKTVAPRLGIASNELDFQTATNSSTTCVVATSTVISAIDSGRMGFLTTNDGTNKVYLCRAATGCTATTGARISAAGGSYEQTDGYKGAYSCIADTATTTLTYWTSH